MKRAHMVVGTISLSALAVVMLFVFADGHSASEKILPSDADIRQILVGRIDFQHQSVGISVGIIGPREGA